MRVDTDDGVAPRLHQVDDERRPAATATASTSSSARTPSRVRPLAARDEPRRAAAADQRPARRHVARRPAPVHPVRDRALRAAPLRALPRPAGPHRALAGDRARALDLRRGARHGRRLRARLVARARPAAALPHAPDGARPEGERRERASHRLAPTGRRRVGAGRRRRPRLLGPEPRPQPPRASRRRTRSRSATREPSALDASVAAIRRCARPRDFDERARRPRDRRGRDRDAGLAPLRARRGGAARPASTSSSRSRSPARRPRASSCIELADERGLVLMPGHTFLYSPPVNMIRELIESRRARRDLLHLDEPREPRAAPARRQRRLGPRPARLLDPALLARRDAARVSRASAAAASSRARPTSRSSTSSSRRARSRTSSSRGSRRASCAGRRSSARARWSSTTTRATSRCASSTRASSLPTRRRFGEYRLTYRTGDIVSPRVDGRRAARARARGLLHGDPHGEHAALVAQSSGSRSCG